MKYLRFNDIKDKSKRKDGKSPFNRFKKGKESTRQQQPPAKILVSGSDYEYTESEASEDMLVRDVIMQYWNVYV